ncbi:TPA: Flp pilus assembly complex ATPase component TadA [Streptococcus pneumoniae]|nr:Flp pilus assembly complex ATPase component TadA [Streptococcus pneumoniae]
MYRVIEMYGDFEPWWFLEGWEEDIVASRKFDQYYDALKYYKTCWFRLEQESPLYKSRSDLMTIFWDPEDQRWCDECDEYLQQYHSLALLQDEQVIPDEKLRSGYEKQTSQDMVQEIAQEIIRSARKKGTQDIYFVPKLDAYELHMRVGDERCKIGSYDFEKFAAVISHFKFVAGMNVGEKRRSQLGSCDYAYDQKIASLRLSTVGDYRGHESLVIRLLHDEEQDLHFWFQDIEELGKQYRQRGLYLFAGPVGSGKTTLMHELSKSLFKGQQVMSIEDPVEIKQDDMLQLQLNEAIGLTYENLIKLSLRHRPDLLIIGEIRDSETARAVVRASLTGATVFSTIHAKSIRGVYERLLELGVSEEELAVVLQGVCYQRLIGGGGIVDFANRDYQEHQAAKWNEQIDQLLKDGHITSLQAETEKISYS